MDTVIKENAGLQNLWKFQDQLKPITEAFENIIKANDIKEGVTIKVTNGSVRTFIDVEEFRKD